MDTQQFAKDLLLNSLNLTLISWKETNTEKLSNHEELSIESYLNSMYETLEQTLLDKDF